jgi:ribosomal protein S18 acetylase RimI-like enzyme
MNRTQGGAAWRGAAGSEPAASGLVIRQAGYTDRAAIRDFLVGLSIRSRYLRFFTGASPTGPAMLRILAGGDDRTDIVVAIEDGVVIGHGMAADRTEPGGTHVTEIGVVVTDACQGRGIGTALVRTVAARARARGAAAATMEVLAENRRMLSLIAHHWPAACQQRSGPYVMVRARLPRPERTGLPRWEEHRPPQPGEERSRGRLAVSR